MNNLPNPISYLPLSRLQKARVDKVRSSETSIIAVHESINEITSQLGDLLASTTDQRIVFFTLRTNLLTHGIRSHIEKWVAAFGEIFRERAHTASRELQDSIRVSSSISSTKCSIFVFLEHACPSTSRTK